MRRLFLLFILIFLTFIYRGAIFGNKIVFPSNYLASFYSPWSTEKFPGWEQGIPHKPIGADQLRFFYPNRSFGFHLWNPYVFAGNPFFANFQSALFYPLNGLYLFLPQLKAWSILIIIQPLLATIFGYLFLASLSIKKQAAMFGAFAFGFSGFIITWSQEAMAVGQSVVWLPLILYGLEKKRAWVAALALTCSILAGYLQTTVYISVFAVAYGLYRRTEIKKIVLIFLLALGLSAIQLAPSLEAFSLSARPTATIEKVFDTYLLPATHLVKLVAPDINGNPGAYNYFGTGSYNETVSYIGLVPLIFALLAMWKVRQARFFTFSAAITFLFTSNFPIIRWLLHLPLPLIPTFQPSRILILTTFSLAAAAAWGFSVWWENRQKYERFLVIICCFLLGILALMLAYYKLTLWPPYFSVALKNSLIPAGILLAIVFVLKTRAVLPILLALTIFGQFYFFNKYLNLGNEHFLYPENKIFTQIYNFGSPDRFVAFSQPVLGNFATQFRVYSPEGYDPIFSKRYGQLLYAGRDFVNGRISDDLPRIEVTLSQVTMNKEKLSRLLNLLGVRNIFNYDSAWQYQENNQALPRAFLVSDFLVETIDQKILDKIFDPMINLGQTIILEEKPQINLASSSGMAKIITYEPEKVEIETQTESPKLLFLSDNYYPGWQATVDNKPTKIYRADFSFRSVIVPAGKHLVKFIYQPVAFEIGKIITLATGLLLCLQRWRRQFPFDVRPEQ